MRYFRLCGVYLTTLLLTFGCRKDADEYSPTSAGKQDLVAEARASFGSLNLPNAGTILPTAGNPRLADAKTPRWQEARLVQKSFGPAVETPLSYAHRIYAYSEDNPQLIYDINVLTKLLSYKDAKGVFHHEIITYSPDKNYRGPGTPFRGIITVEDVHGQLLKRFYYDRDGKEYRSAALTGRPAASRTIEICHYTTYSVYYASDPGNAYTWTECTGCDYIDIAMNVLDGGDSGGGGSDYGGGGGGGTGTGDGAGSSPDLPSLPTPTVVAPKKPIVSIPDYLKCYSTDLPAGHQFSVTVCVQQPVPGTREPWTFTTALNPYPVAIGHTFLVLTESWGSTTISRNIGFYPTQFTYPGASGVPGQFGNDEDHSFNISVTIPLSGEQFYNVLNFYERAASVGTDYDLNTNNCTTASLNALAAGGVSLPRTFGTWPLGTGNDPGDLGEDLRTLPLPFGWARNTNGGTKHVNIGVCN